MRVVGLVKAAQHNGKVGKLSAKAAQQEGRVGVETPYEMAKTLWEARTGPEVRWKAFIEKFQLESHDRGRKSFPAGDGRLHSFKKQA